MAKVHVIPPKAARSDTLRVAAYCRVSSDSADQLHSCAAQIRTYTQTINAHDGWELVDIYADEGLTGTRMDKREDFNRLMADCRKGKIDKIVMVLWALIQGVNFCLYHVQKTKSIYLMRRLPDRWELVRRCWSLPLMMVGLALVTYGLLLGISWGIYVLAAPRDCIAEGQWQRLWTVWRGGFLWLK